MEASADAAAAASTPSSKSAGPRRRFASSSARRSARGTRRGSRRVLAAVDPDGDRDYTTSLAGRITPPIPNPERVHRTLEARPLPPPLPPPPPPSSSREVAEDGSDRVAAAIGLPVDGRDGSSKRPPSASSSGAVRRRKRRISRRLASPRSVLVGSGHYLISPWTTELDEEDEEEHDSDAVPVVDARAPLPSRDATAAAEREDEAASLSGGLRRRRRSRRTKLSTSGSSLASARENEVGVRRDDAADDDGAVPRPDSAAAAAAAKTEREKIEEARNLLSFTAFRITYLIVHIAIMLADGLQGTHLYVLYEGYGYSVASLYCLGFVSGAFTSPFIGPFVDKIGRKKSAILYCALEVFINLLEQYPHFAGLIISRVIGGITTNLLFSVFESWLVTEHRRRGYAEDKLETILRDSVIASNLAAIASGWLAHFLATKFGPVGPFEGAVTCTAVALVLVAAMWTENHGCATPGVKSVRQYMSGALKTIVSDTNISRIGVIQGLSEGALQTFVFLWSPALRHFAARAPRSALGLDVDGQPAYGLIFGAFMACGVLGGLAEPSARRIVTYLVRDCDRRAGIRRSDTVVFDGRPGEEAEEEEVKPAAVEFLATLVYLISAALLLTPFLMPEDSPYAFSVSLAAFLVYEFMVGLYMPCEGVIRSIYMPTSSICSLMTMLRVIVNVAVALGVVSTNYIPFTTAFASISALMLTSAAVQLTLVSPQERDNFAKLIGMSRRSSFRLLHSIRWKEEEVSGKLPPPPPLQLSPVSLSSHADETSEEEEEEDQFSD